MAMHQCLWKRGIFVFLLITQHARLAEQIKYFPWLESTAKKNEATLESVALMQDRIWQGKEQLYGTQARSIVQSIMQNQYSILSVISKCEQKTS
jgi:hypothetical protein